MVGKLEDVGASASSGPHYHPLDRCYDLPLTVGYYCDFAEAGFRAAAPPPALLALFPIGTMMCT